MIAIRMKKFYKKTGRRVRVDGTPIHLLGIYKQRGHIDGKQNERDLILSKHQEAGKQEKNQMGLLTMDDGIVNWGEHTEVEETNHALMAISSSSEVSLCSKTCIDSYNTLKTLCDEQMNQLGERKEAQILAYSQAVKKLEAQLGMKAVKEKEQLQKTLDSWKDSSKNLWRLINSGMSSNSKVSLGYELQSNNEVLSYEEEMNFSVFNCSEEDSVGKPLYSRFIKTNDFKGVPHPLSGDYTPTPQEEIDESLSITNAPSSTSSPSNNSFEIQQMAALLEDKMNIRMSRLEKAISEKNVTTPATIKAVEEVYVTCGSNHNFNNCPFTRNDYPVFHDNIHQFQQTAAVGNFVQRNPPNLANQIRPPGFNQPNVQNNQGNQSRYQGNNFNSNQNRGVNFNQNNQGAVYQAPPYQPPTNQPLVNQALPPVSSTNQGVTKNGF
ncbi:hypothetical protein Tco_1156240 [Tanacetum coccineum]